LAFDTDRWQEIMDDHHQQQVSQFSSTAFGVFWGILMLVLMVGAGKALETGIFLANRRVCNQLGLFPRQSVQRNRTKVLKKA